MDIVLRTGHDGPIGQRHANRRHLSAAAGWLDEGGPTREERRPFAGILGRGDLPIGTIHQGVGTIAEQPVLSHLGGLQGLAQHRLDGVSPQRHDCTDLGWRRM